MVAAAGIEAFLDYECRASQRYRRAMSLVIVRIADSASTFDALVGDLVRSSDKVIQYDGGAAIIMSETALEGARIAVGRYAARCANGSTLQCAVARFPEDALTANELLRAAQRRYEKARTLQGDSFIWSDVSTWP